MELAALFEELSADALTASLSTIRLLAAFLMMPLFSEDLVPPLVRNAIFLAFAAVVAWVLPGFDGEAVTATRWLVLAGKEAFVGLAIGTFFGLFLWAFEAAGTVLDTQIGASLGTVQDPISGHDVTLLGDLLGRWAGYVFMASGGFLLLVTALLDSFAIWPVDRALPDVAAASVTLFEAEFGAFATLAVMVAAPVLVVLFVIDMLFGLVNRFARRVDVLFLSMALKGLVALLLVALLLPVLLEVLTRQIESRDEALGRFLLRVLSGDAP